MLADLSMLEKEKAKQTAMKIARSSSLLKLATMLGALLMENARLLAEVNRLRVRNGEQPLDEYRL